MSGWRSISRAEIIEVNNNILTAIFLRNKLNKKKSFDKSSSGDEKDCK